MTDTVLSPTGLTVPEFARLHRVGPDKVYGWIARGELGALNLASAQSGRPRFVILPQHVAEFERRRRVAAPPRPARKRRTTATDFYPDEQG